MAVAAALLGACAATHAATVTSGYLSRADGSETITDTLNNRTWLGADVTKALDFTQTLAALAGGGRFDGYQMGSYEDAMKYVLATTSGSALCESVNYGNGADYATCQGNGTARSVGGRGRRSETCENRYSVVLPRSP